MIAAQMEERIEEAGNVCVEVERMTTLGRLTPELWMQHATGKPVGPAALLHAAERALDQLH